jgi:hypothetical protein
MILKYDQYNMACLLKIYLQKNHEVPKMSHSRRIKTSGWCAQYIQELMADLDNIQIWKLSRKNAR